MMISRDMAPELKQAAKEYPIVALLGPRQSGKTTLARHQFAQHRYVNLEDIELRERALEDPRGFVVDMPNEYGLIIDEAQYAPHLFSYLQVIADELKKPGYFVLTGSQNFTLHERITQSLAGRIATLTLLPCSIHELKQAHLLPDRIEQFVLQGGYPALYTKELGLERFFKNYITNYIQKDVRQVRQLTDIVLFTKFLRLCAARTGQTMNLQALSEQLGVSAPTVQAWVSLLVASYIVVLLPSYGSNHGKRVLKTPKLYFLDTGLACYMLNIQKDTDLLASPMRGALIETAIVADLYKQYYNLDKEPQLYFWRGYEQREVDVIIDRSPQPVALEIKASKTVSPRFFSTLKYWNSLTKTSATSNYVVYAGPHTQTWPQGTVTSWEDAGTIIRSLLQAP